MRIKQEVVIHFRGHHGRGFRPRDAGPRINERIRVPEVRVIGSDGSQLGVMTPQQAIQQARDEGYDLVEISPTAKPPVCKIMDYGKFKYEKQKKEQESRKRQTKITLKEIKLRPNTDKHDIEFKMNHVRRFLEQKDKAKITIQFRGREMAHIDRSREQLTKIIADLANVGEPESPPKIEGRTLSVIMMPKGMKPVVEHKAVKKPVTVVAAPNRNPGPSAG